MEFLQGSLNDPIKGYGNVALGYLAARHLIDGNGNIAVGNGTGLSWVGAESNNIAIGSNGVTGDNGTIRLGTSGTHTSTYIAGIRGISVSGAQMVVIDANGKLGSQTIPAVNPSSSYFVAGSQDNTASGVSALQANTTGTNNTANGKGSLQSNASGANNTALGALSGGNQTTGSGNLALGYQAGANWTTGSNNIALAAKGIAGESATIRIGTQGTHSRAFMAGIRGVSVSGGQSVVVDANGQLGVVTAIPGTLNTATGTGALQSNTTGSFNTGTGTAALAFNTTGSNNTASGYNALQSNTAGSANTANGVDALKANTTGGSNTASGVSALRSNTTGASNVAFGYEAAKAQTTANANTALGYQAGLKWTTGTENIAIGAGAGKNQTTGNNNIAIGANGSTEDTGTIRIGKKNKNTSTFIAGIRGVNVTGGQAVVVTSSGQLGVVSSSARYKQDIQPMGDASNPLMQLRPVTFHYKQAEQDGRRPLQYGLVAEEVAEVMPELAIYNEDGSPESVAYQVLPSLLLNEYQKQNKELKQTQAKLAAVESDYKAKLEATESKLVANETKLETMEAEMASMKAMLLHLAAANDNNKQLAQAGQ